LPSKETISDLGNLKKQKSERSTH